MRVEKIHLDFLKSQKGSQSEKRKNFNETFKVKLSQKDFKNLNSILFPYLEEENQEIKQKTLSLVELGYSKKEIYNKLELEITYRTFLKIVQEITKKDITFELNLE